jgi:phosphatidylinositol-bisphosphatase
LEASYQRWITKQLESRALEYSQVHKVTICCASWNVNAREINDTCDLGKWLLSSTSPPADIYAIGLQEIVDLNVMNVVINSTASDDKSTYWHNQVLRVLHSTGVEYGLLTEKHMVGLQLMVFTRLSLRPSIGDVRSAHVYTGGYGVTGNKGGITIRFDIFDSPLCFVCAHFHANRENVEQRNLDFQTILQTTVLPPMNTATKRPSLSTGNLNTSSSRPDSRRDSLPNRHYSLNLKSSNPGAPLTIDSHEQIFWFGDLNYRIVEDLEEHHVFEIVQSGNWTGLRSKDQLNVEREKGAVFQNFEEGILNFPPTYKYQPGTNSYEQRPDKKLRAPAWCDRVLWKSSNRESIQQLSYQVAPLNISDHKPITAWFECGVRKVILEKAREVYQDLLFAVDKWINASTPKLSLENRMYDYGMVTINVSC